MIQVHQVSALEKIFLHEKREVKEQTKLSALKGERISWQIVYHKEERGLPVYLDVKTDSPFPITVRQVGNVPVGLAGYDTACDDNYISLEPGLYPDILQPMEHVRAVMFQNRALWVTVRIPEDAEAGDYSVRITLSNAQESFEKTCEMQIQVINAVLPKQTLKYTNWFHGDCIASYYKLEMFSEEHWRRLEQFVQTAVHCGVNMLLTPLFTPPLDTEVGGERPTIQLVDVSETNGGYAFDFSKLKRWINMCKKCGISYFEMSHLFTQWGAEYTPKIEVQTKNGMEKRFGWHMRADSEEYQAFLDVFLPELTAFLKAEGIAENTYFHVSDEPSEQHLENYAKAKQLVKKHLAGFKMMDALSDVAFYQKGLVEIPVPETGTADKFAGLETLPERWCYYCCGQSVDLSNRFIAMPSARNRILGSQLYKYQMEGFLHWGYNFYYTQFSKWEINPFMETDAGAGFPSGDSFVVYPGESGPLESIRSEVFYQAIQDFSAMRLLESLAGREAVLAILEREGEITFKSYPKTAEFVLETRELINQEIALHS